MTTFLEQINFQKVEIQDLKDQLDAKQHEVDECEDKIICLENDSHSEVSRAEYEKLLEENKKYTSRDGGWEKALEEIKKIQDLILLENTKIGEAREKTIQENEMLKKENKLIKEENKLLKKKLELEILWAEGSTEDLYIKDPETDDQYSFGPKCRSKLKDDIADNSKMKRILRNGSIEDCVEASAFYMFKKDGVLYYVGRSSRGPLHIGNIKGEITNMKVTEEIKKTIRDMVNH